MNELPHTSASASRIVQFKTFLSLFVSIREPQR
jgi:hypothetical protein